jgi:hypothetical protein
MIVELCATAADVKSKPNAPKKDKEKRKVLFDRVGHCSTGQHDKETRPRLERNVRLVWSGRDLSFYRFLFYVFGYTQFPKHFDGVIDVITHWLGDVDFLGSPQIQTTKFFLSPFVVDVFPQLSLRALL